MTTQNELPIGVFDSGLGGLSILKELRHHLPNENFVYLGDVARLPYGTKSRSVVSRYAKQALDFLLEKKVKVVVVACNTATAMSLEDLRSETSVGVFGVIEPGVSAALRATRSKKILVLATRGTVRSEAYLNEFRLADSAASVQQIACPLLVSLVEEGWHDKHVTEEIIADYLAEGALHEFDTVLLGCTHFPLLGYVFRKVLAPGVEIVHGGQRLAEELEAHLKARNLIKGTVGGTLEFYSTDLVGPGNPILISLFPHAKPFELVDL